MGIRLISWVMDKTIIDLNICSQIHNSQDGSKDKNLKSNIPFYLESKFLMLKISKDYFLLDYPLNFCFYFIVLLAYFLCKAKEG